MKILMASSYLPYPLHSGGQVRLYNLIKELSKKNEITLICEKRLHQTEDDIKEVEKICKKVITVERKKQWSLRNIFKTFITPHSFLITGHTNNQMQEIIEEELRQQKFDLIHVETFYVSQNLPKLINIPVVLIDHNVEYLVYKKFMNKAPFFIRPLLAIDITKIKNEEISAWKKADKVVAVSSEDKKEMEKSGINSSIVSNGVNIDKFSFKEKTKRQLKKILFIGDFKWIQNRDSIEFIIKNIWPLINQKSDFRLWIVGRKIPNSIRKLTDDPNIIFDEESSKKSAEEIFQEADVLLAPIRVGGGTSYKILESMSCGTPVVTMIMSADAIRAKNGEHLMVGKNTEELAEKTVELLENKNLYEKVAKNGRKLIEEKYAWKNIAKNLEDVYKGVIK